MFYDGKKIALLREAKGWKMAELARRAKISQPSLWALEHQVTKRPKAETLFNIAVALGVPMKELMRKRTRTDTSPGIEAIEALYDALDEGNKRVLIAAAEALLKNQSK